LNKETVLKEILDNFQVPEGRTKKENWAQVDSKIKISEGNLISNRSMKRFIPFGIAASIALAFMFLWNPGETTYSSNLEYKAIDLPDGSIAELGPNSSLSYADNGKSRLLELEGTAYFKVVRGKPFIVESRSCEVKVLGTSFKLSDLENNFDVKCYTGLVQVSADQKVYKLNAGKGINSFRNNSLYEHSQNYNDAKESLEYNSEYLSSILLDLKVKRGINITNHSTSNPVISYSINDESTAEILTTLSTISGLKLLKLSENTYELR